MQSGLFISRLKQRRVEHSLRSTVEGIDKKPRNLMIGFVQLPGPFEIVVVKKHPLSNRQPMHKLRQESSSIDIGAGRKPMCVFAIC